MRGAACVLLAVMLVSAGSAGAQDAAALPDSFAFDYDLSFSTAGLDTFAADFALSGSGAVDQAAHAFDVALAGTMTLGTRSGQTAEELRWVGGSLYLNTGSGWQAREDAAAYLAELVTRYAFVDADPAALAAWDLSGIDALGAVLSALASADPAAFLTAQRLGDETVGDTAAAHYRTSVDLNALMQTEAFVNAAAALASAQGTMLMTFEHEELADVIRANSAMFTKALVRLNRYVGLEDGLLRRVVLDVDLSVDPGQGGYPNPPFTLTLRLDLTLRDLNQPQKITAPDDAQPVSEFTFPAPEMSELGAADVSSAIYFASVPEGGSAEQTFDAHAGDVVTMTTSGLDLEFDSILTLLAPDGATLAENDDHETPSFVLGDYQSQIVDYEIPADGTYTARVADIDGAAGSVVLNITIRH